MVSKRALRRVSLVPALVRPVSHRRVSRALGTGEPEGLSRWVQDISYNPCQSKLKLT